MTTQQRAQARYLRSHLTNAEQKIWACLRNQQLGVKFRRQQTIGPYIVDFFCAELNLVIEIDGGQHNPIRDHDRDAFLSSEGFIICRYWNNDVIENIDGVLTNILSIIEKQFSPPPQPSPLKGEEEIE